MMATEMTSPVARIRACHVMRQDKSLLHANAQKLNHSDPNIQHEAALYFRRLVSVGTCVRPHPPLHTVHARVCAINICLSAQP